MLKSRRLGVIQELKSSMVSRSEMDKKCILVPITLVIHDAVINGPLEKADKSRSVNKK